MRRQDENWFGVAGAKRARTLQRSHQIRGRSSRRQGRIDQENLPRAALGNLLGKDVFKKNAKILNPLSPYGNPGRHGVAPAFDENSRCDRRADDAAKIDAGNRATGSSSAFADARPGNRESRPLEPVLQP